MIRTIFIVDVEGVPLQVVQVAREDVYPTLHYYLVRAYPEKFGRWSLQDVENAVSEGTIIGYEQAMIVDL